MGTSYSLTDAVCNSRHHHSLLTSYSNHVHILSHIIRLLHQGDRQEHRRTCFTAKADTLSRAIVNTHNLIVNRVNTDETAARVATTREEVFIYFLLNDAHFTTLCHIHIVEIAAIAHLGLTHPLVVFLHTIDTYSGLTITVVCSTAIREKHRTHHVKFRNTALQTLHILILHIPSASLSESFIGFGCGLRPHHSAVGGKALEVLVQHFLHALSASYEGHQHKHTPEDAKTREERTALVACQRVENLSICI